MPLGLILLTLSAAPPADGPAPLTLERTIPLSGVEGRFDHFAADLKSKRICLAALGNGTLVVISAAEGKVAGEVKGLAEPQGVLVMPGTGEIAVACGKDGTLRVFEGSSLDPLQRLEAGEDADNVRLDAAAGRVYVGCEKSLAVFDAAKWKKVGAIPLDGHAESFQLEKAGKRIFVNVPDTGQVAVIDREKGAVTAKWKPEGASANFPMALDEPGRRLFIGCRKPPRILVFDTGTGKEIAALECSGDMDDLFLDAAAHRLYASCGEGALDVFRQVDADHYTRLARMPTAPGARTSLLVPELRSLFLAVPHRGAQAAEVRIYRLAD